MRMLYDPKREYKTVNPCTNESLIAWLETMPAKGKYDYYDCKGKCLYGLYMAAHGILWKESGGDSNTASGPERADFCKHVYSYVGVSLPWTFGAALERARKAPNYIKPQAQKVSKDKSEPIV